MKPIKKFLVLIAAMSTLSTACTNDFEKHNIDPNRIETINPGTLLNPVIYEVASFNTGRSNGFTFDLMQVTLPFGVGEALGVHHYNISENAGSSTWNTYYRWLANLKEMREAAEKVNDPNYKAVALTLNAWVYSLLTDTFGDVPMDEASRAGEGIYYPAYNTQQEIYTRILADLETANSLFDAAKPMVYGTDILYGNDIAKWKKFTNSLRLRLLLRIAKRTEMNANAKMAEIIIDPVKFPVFTKNDDAAILKITGVTPLVSPWGRAIDFTNGRAAGEFFIDNLNEVSDPRLPKFFTQAKAKDGTVLGYKGIPGGYSGNNAQFNFTPSNLNISFATAPMVSVIMTYAEVEFIKAELALKGIAAGSAQAHYENGVKAAIEQWGAALPATYFANPKAAFDGTLERIMLQKYYALFFNDNQQWFEHRRTGLPVLPKGNGMVNNKTMPSRLRYPTTQMTNNATNYQKAAAAMGGDDINTRVWWEK
ncbi:SusD/RagB family nutrient-binding outer membrane lipoprotein [Adhaeribacter soli]|uniref:SusD/RagB family nutrient-binding outer membrane lipoprotein n=1 Tax=Adhaeribacter soli TaxID=2607655 RepID=A0A5N1J7N4_9BACT|nr:SusD/RagB family nutrient-binding outer membrane lipoprotein [Adhaeribacter soli]KAA9340731.1 SusD/RagB family nutrient-binding outer membrane lipoprotein [Adhaeribacter soli]